MDHLFSQALTEIDTNQIKPRGYYYSVRDLVNRHIENNQVVDNELLSWIINPPPIYASAESDEMDKIKEEHVKRYYEEKPRSHEIVRNLKKEFYSFICTESQEYEKERSQIGNNINVLITGLSSAIATKLGSIEIGVVTSFIAIFMIMVGKMGKRAICESFKPENPT